MRGGPATGLVSGENGLYNDLDMAQQVTTADAVKAQRIAVQRIAVQRIADAVEAQRIADAAWRAAPEFDILRAKVLEHGGEEIDTRINPDALALIDHGYLMDGPVVCRSRGMEPNGCHENTARLWLLKRRRDALTGIATGYALGDRFWRQHSWGLRKYSLLETRDFHGRPFEGHEKYWGIRMEGAEADLWALRVLWHSDPNFPVPGS